MNRKSIFRLLFCRLGWLFAVLPLATTSSKTLYAQSVMLLNEGAAEIISLNCTHVKSADGLTITTNEEEKDALVDISLSSESVRPLKEGFVELHFRMKTSVNGDLGEYIVYWIAGDATQWKTYQRIPFRPDGEWHDYRLPLNSAGELKALRFTFGKQSHQVELGGLRLVKSTSALPAELAKKAAKLPKVVQLSQDNLSLEIHSLEHPLGHRYEITDQSTGRTWSSEPVSLWLELYDVEKTTDHSLRLSLYDRFSGQTFSAEIQLESGSVARFSIDTEDPQTPFYSASCYPPRFSVEMSDGHFVFCDRSCGVLLDQKDDTYAHWPLRVYGNTHCLDMPWVGLFDEKRGDGLMLLVETPADAEVAFVADDKGLHWPEVRWLPSMDQFRYRRTASLRFASKGGYNELATIYREYLKDQGRFRTLAEKAEQKPAVEKLKGAPALWGARFPTKFIRQMRPLGLERGIVGNCKDPGIVAWLNDLGYLTGRYDNYVDITDGETRFTSGDVQRAAVRPRPGSAPKHGWKLRSGTQMYWRSSACWPEVVESYVTDELDRIPFTSRFIDVTAAGDLSEDYHPEHTFDRRQDLIHRRELYQHMNEYGLVLGTEHGNDWVTDLVEYFEGSMSGPFWWSSWEAGHLVRPRRDQLTEKYLKYGMGYANRLPLWELVYHDCAVTTWYWGDTAGLLYESAPELADRKDLFNILYGTTPLFWVNNTGYRLPEEIHRFLRTYHDTCQLHQVVAFQQMVSHEFLSADRSLQRTRFSDGTVVVANFADDPQPYKTGDRELLLAPNGYHVQSNNFLQQRLWVNNAPQTIISKNGYLTVHGNGIEPIRGITCGGRVTAFRTGEDRWNVFMEQDHLLEINVSELTGWNPSDKVWLCHMDDVGDIHATAAQADARGNIRYQSNQSTWRFVLLRENTEKPATTSAQAPDNLQDMSTK